MNRSASLTGPARWTPFLYLWMAQSALISVAAVTLWDPSGVAGFFYHPKMIAAVHTVTLGWISSSLIGLLYLAARPWGLRAGRLDVIVFVAWAAGSSGLASHFWIESFGGMTWSAGLAGLAILFVAVRFSMSLATTTVDPATRLQLNLAWLNLVATAAIGLLIGINKTTPILPGYSLHNVFAHAHLAVLGWAFLLVSGMLGLAAAGKRSGSRVAVRIGGTLLVQLGAAGIFVSLLTADSRLPVFAGLALAGVLVCVVDSTTLVGYAPAAVKACLLAAAGWLGLAASIGLRLLGGTEPVSDPDSILIYGAFGLLGGLGQAVLGLVLLALSARGLHGARLWIPVGAWALAAPTLALGLTDGAPLLARSGAGALLIAGLATTCWTIAAARNASAG